MEQNAYTGLEYQPSARLLWTPDPQHSAWGAISRAVRTPSRIEEQGVISLLPTPTDTLPIVPRVYGDPALVSEAVIAYELGFREQMTERFSWDIAAFYNVYDHLIVGASDRRPFP